MKNLTSDQETRAVKIKGETALVSAHGDFGGGTITVLRGTETGGVVSTAQIITEPLLDEGGVAITLTASDDLSLRVASGTLIALDFAGSTGADLDVGVIG